MTENFLSSRSSFPLRPLAKRFCMIKTFSIPSFQLMMPESAIVHIFLQFSFRFFAIKPPRKQIAHENSFLCRGKSLMKILLFSVHFHYDFESSDTLIVHIANSLFLTSSQGQRRSINCFMTNISGVASLHN